MKVIDLLNKIANGELENGTKFRDKYTQKEYVFKPNSYAGIYPPDTSKSDEDWLLTLHSGWFRLDQEVEIIEDKKIRKICTFPGLDDNDYAYEDGNRQNNVKINNKMEELLIDKINEIIDKINGIEE